MKRDITRYRAVDDIASPWAFRAFHAPSTESILLLFLQAKKPRRRVIYALVVDVGSSSQSDLMPLVIHVP